VSSRIPQYTGKVRFDTELDFAMRDFEKAVVRIDGVDPLTTELVRLRCARLHDCRNCKSLRIVAAIEAGFDEEIGRKIDSYESSDLEPKHKAALRLADAMIFTPGNVDPDLGDELRKYFTDAQIGELCLDVVKWSVQKALVALRLEPPPREGLSQLFMLEDGSFSVGEALEPETAAV
jgi:hypothetical protein